MQVIILLYPLVKKGLYNISKISFQICNMILLSFCLCNRKEQKWVVKSFLCHGLLILCGYLISCSHTGGFVTSLSLSLKQIRKLIGKRGDPFYEAQENHNLIGVANVFLECLFYDVKLQYAVPIISQQGEVGPGWSCWELLWDSWCSWCTRRLARKWYLPSCSPANKCVSSGLVCSLCVCLQVAGRLHVEVMRVTGSVPERVVEGDDSSENSSESGSLEVTDNNGEIIHRAKKLSCRVSENTWWSLQFQASVT